MLLRVIDFETTGDTAQDAVCQIGYCDVKPNEDGAIVSATYQFFTNPNRPMPPQARAIHHIGDEDLLNARPISDGFRLLMDCGAGKQPDAFVAHNAEFERMFFAGGSIPWICTLKVARRLWPDCPSHSNQCLRYWLGLDLASDRAMPPHRAGPDAYVTAWILSLALKEMPAEDMIRVTREPSLLPGPIRFGKHKGAGWLEVPRDYLWWIVSKSDMDADTKFTARYWLEKDGHS